jgi:hypothetical protein
MVQERGFGRHDPPAVSCEPGGTVTLPYELRCFPSADTDFARATRESMAKLGDHPPSNHDRLPERLAEALRAAYPRVVVVRADPMATYTGQPVLYAYRDGSARSGAGS